MAAAGLRTELLECRLVSTGHLRADLPPDCCELATGRGKPAEEHPSSLRDE
jgi:hypothetical protein